MNSAVYRNGTSFVESLFETFGEFEFLHDAFECMCICKYHVTFKLAKGKFKCMLLSFTDCELGDLKDVTDDLKEDKTTQADTLKQASGKCIIPTYVCFCMHVVCSPSFQHFCHPNDLWRKGKENQIVGVSLAHMLITLQAAGRIKN